MKEKLGPHEAHLASQGGWVTVEFYKKHASSPTCILINPQKLHLPVPHH